MGSEEAREASGIAVGREEAVRKPVVRLGVGRGLALFFGAFGVVNGVGEMVSRGFDANVWWMDPGVAPAAAARMVVFVASAVLLACGGWPRRNRWLAGAGVAAAVGLMFIAAMNAATFYRLVKAGVIVAGVPVPVSLIMAAAMGMVFWVMLRGPRGEKATRREWGVAGVTVLMCAVGFPVVQMVLFGKADHRREADVIVVMGARAYADGTPSDALADRVRTACELYHRGYGKVLIMSGGPGDGEVHETEAMKRYAVSMGVPAKAIVKDEGGVNTEASVRETGVVFKRMSARPRVLVVSHFYHLPRVKLAYRRAGWEVYTVPAKERHMLTKMPYLMAREVAALWVYYFK